MARDTKQELLLKMETQQLAVHIYSEHLSGRLLCANMKVSGMLVSMLFICYH